MSDLLKLTYKAIDERLGEDIEIIDFRNESPFLDYFVICSAKNQRMAKSIIENIEDKALMEGYNVKHIYAENTTKWLLIDMDSVVCHVFYDGEREVYNLEGLWKDLPRIEM